MHPTRWGAVSATRPNGQDRNYHAAPHGRCHLHPHRSAAGRPLDDRHQPVERTTSRAGLGRTRTRTVPQRRDVRGSPRLLAFARRPHQGTRRADAGASRLLAPPALETLAAVISATAGGQWAVRPIDAGGSRVKLGASSRRACGRLLARRPPGESLRRCDNAGTFALKGAMDEGYSS